MEKRALLALGLSLLIFLVFMYVGQKTSKGPPSAPAAMASIRIVTERILELARVRDETITNAIVRASRLATRQNMLSGRWQSQCDAGRSVVTGSRVVPGAWPSIPGRGMWGPVNVTEHSR